jgi:hypothetical protein
MKIFARTETCITTLLTPCETGRLLLESLPNEEKETVGMWIFLATCRVSSDHFLLNMLSFATEGEEAFRRVLRGLLERYIEVVFDDKCDIYGWKSEKFRKRLKAVHHSVENGVLPYFEKDKLEDYWHPKDKLEDYWHPLADVDPETLICMGFD